MVLPLSSRKCTFFAASAADKHGGALRFNAKWFYAASAADKNRCFTSVAPIRFYAASAADMNEVAELIHARKFYAVITVDKDWSVQQFVSKFYVPRVRLISGAR